MEDAQRATLAEIAKRMGRRALEQVASVAKPETILAWYRKLIARKFDGSKHRAYPGRPGVSREIAELVVRMARENRGRGYDRIAGALKNLGHNIFRSNRGQRPTPVWNFPCLKASAADQLGGVHSLSS